MQIDSILQKHVKLDISVHGVPFATFYDVVNEQQEQNDLLDVMLSDAK